MSALYNDSFSDDDDDYDGGGGDDDDDDGDDDYDDGDDYDGGGGGGDDDDDDRLYSQKQYGIRRPMEISYKSCLKQVRTILRAGEHAGRV
jgi:hypothetical protein